eukprot:92216-Rhodomonas_salina.2
MVKALGAASAAATLSPGQLQARVPGVVDGVWGLWGPANVRVVQKLDVGRVEALLRHTFAPHPS